MTQLETPLVTLPQPMAAPAPGATRERGRDPLALPPSVDARKIDFGVVIVFAAVHLLALAAFVPWLFSWSGVAVFVVTLYLIGGLGINVCYHRLLTHRSFTTPKWFERVLTTLAFCNLEGSSLRWVATHRMHHQHSDEQPDPHSPWVSFLWSHIGWMVIRNRDIDDYDTLSRYARDLANDPFHATMHRTYGWLVVWLIHAGLIFGAGWAVGHLSSGAWLEGLRMGLSFLVWGVFLRGVAIWHITWSINSITHLWGYRNYKTSDDSRNNWLMGYLAFGEGWHNNHHADQRSAKAGHRWWELDLAYLAIRLFGLVGLAGNIVTPASNCGTKHDIRKKKV